MDLSIIVAHRGNPMGLWMTIQACEMDLRKTELTREYLVVGNGQKEAVETKLHMAELKKSGLLTFYLHVEEALAPPHARQIASEQATGDILCFFDNHAIPQENYFLRAIKDFEKYGEEMDMIHSAYRYDIYQETKYHYHLQLDKNFWSREATFPQHEFKPYRMAMGGHGGFFIRRKVWEEVEGYWTGFRGYAGEEPYFDLKMALLDKKIWMDPKVVHIHYVGERGYARHFSEDYYRNLMCAANIIGGEKWLYKAFDVMERSVYVGRKPIFDVMMDAVELSNPHKKWLDGIRKRTLDEQLKKFKLEGVAF